MRLKLTTLSLAACLAISSPVSAETSPSVDSGRARVAADDTGINVRDRKDGVTPLDQSNNDAFMKRSAEIRSAIIEDKSLSTYAQNIKIVTTDEGKTFLRGPVESNAERAKIVEIAKAKAGPGKVVNELEVAP